MTDSETRTAELERSNAELRAALMLAGKEIRKLNFGETGLGGFEAHSTNAEAGAYSGKPQQVRQAYFSSGIPSNLLNRCFRKMPAGPFAVPY